MRTFFLPLGITFNNHSNENNLNETKDDWTINILMVVTNHLGVDGWIILGWISRRRDVVIMDWIGLSQDRDRWRTLVSAVMNLGVP